MYLGLFEEVSEHKPYYLLKYYKKLNALTCFRTHAWFSLEQPLNRLKISLLQEREREREFPQPISVKLHAFA